MSLVQRQRDENGVATIEVIGIIPIALVIAGAILQIYMLGYAAVAAESASRLAAREASKGTDSASAESIGEHDVNQIFSPQITIRSGDQSSPGDEPAVDGGSADDAVTAEATLEVPFLGIGLDGLNYQVTRYTVMPVTD